MNKKNKEEPLKNVNTPEIILKWGWPAHTTVVEVIYQEFPEELKKTMNLDKLKDGSNDPDEKFKDTAKHHYPPSFDKATQWLGDGKKSHDKKDYEYSSYCFGVAAHYISDTFSAPHCVSHEKSKDHHNFEVLANDLTPSVKYIPGDLNDLMKKGFEQGQIDWKEWLKTKDQQAAQEEINMGASVAYSAIMDILSP